MVTTPIRICVVTGSRAEYGLLRNLLLLLSSSDYFELQLIVTGSHLDPNSGKSINDIYSDNIPISYLVDMLVVEDTEYQER